MNKFKVKRKNCFCSLTFIYNDTNKKMVLLTKLRTHAGRVYMYKYGRIGLFKTEIKQTSKHLKVLLFISRSVRKMKKKMKESLIQNIKHLSLLSAQNFFSENNYIFVFHLQFSVSLLKTVIMR